ncbi:TetR/AcrR family transcriptional regulator [Campylobacter sp. LR196d]|uniref:TetR/AcrR family transcriptional regulator n=1 Tax=Campylobacter sp. LR196d TaxID=2593543 RepID=UPI00123B79EE|nr:TetR/AcrR family transcriptional regulator [Campylobacter sp. LR196d]KAA6227498.1 TetR/AcrR family transcriptional regulator [Campylobacter sp. LR196d]
MKKNKTPTPKAIARQEKIKEVALELFLTKGYEKTSINDIIKLSGGSYSNIYNTYKNKKDLFLAILEERTTKHFENVTKHLAKIKNNDLKDILYRFGLAFIQIFNDNNTITLGKIIYSQVYSKDKLIATWFNKNRSKFIDQLLTNYFKQQDSKFLSENALELAELFCTMIKDPNYNLSVLMDKKLLSKQEQKKRVKLVVEIFLSGIKNLK